MKKKKKCKKFKFFLTKSPLTTKIINLKFKIFRRMHLKKKIPLSAFRQSLIKSKDPQLVVIRRTSHCKICLAILINQEIKDQNNKGCKNLKE